MARKARFGTGKRAMFLEGLRVGMSISAAAKRIRVARPTVYYYRDRDVEFASDWEAAIEDGTDRLEDEAFRRALEGVEKPVYYQGKAIGRVRDYSDSLLMFMLRARRGEKFREAHKNDPKSAINVDAARAALVSKLLPQEDEESTAENLSETD